VKHYITVLGEIILHTFPPECNRIYLIALNVTRIILQDKTVNSGS